MRPLPWVMSLKGDHTLSIRYHRRAVGTQKFDPSLSPMASLPHQCGPRHLFVSTRFVVVTRHLLAHAAFHRHPASRCLRRISSRIVASTASYHEEESHLNTYHCHVPSRRWCHIS